MDQPTLGSLVFYLIELWERKHSHPAATRGCREKVPTSVRVKYPWESRVSRTGIEEKSVLGFRVQKDSVNQWPLKWNMLALLLGVLQQEYLHFISFLFGPNFAYLIINKTFYSNSICT